jgi:hypothetical protein
VSSVRDFLNKQKQEEEKSPVKKFLSQSLDLSYNYTYAKPADVGPQVPVEPSPTLGDRAEQLGRGIQSTLTQAGGFIGGTIVDPIGNAIEFAESRLVGREPQYRNRFQEAQEVSQNIRQDLGELDTAGEIAFGLGSVAGMVPEMLTGSLPLRGARTATDLLPQGARSMSEVLGREADQAAAASALLAPRFGSQTAYEVEQSGASPLQAGLAGAVETVATPFTNVLPVSRVGGLASRVGTGAVSGVAAEAGVEGVVSPFLPDELRQQRSLTNPENFATAAGAGSTLAAIFGSRRLPNTFSQAEIEALAADPVLRSGAETGANQTARTDAEAQVVSDQALQQAAQQARRAIDETEAKKTEQRLRERPAQPRVQETMDLEVEPTITDMFSGETRPAYDPTDGLTTPEVQQTITRADRNIEQISAQLGEVRSRIAEIEAAPAGARGGFSRSQNSELKRLRTDAARLELGLSDNQRTRQEADAQRILGERGPAEVSPAQGALPLRGVTQGVVDLNPAAGIDPRTGQLDLRTPEEAPKPKQPTVKQLETQVTRAQEELTSARQAVVEINNNTSLDPETQSRQQAAAVERANEAALRVREAEFRLNQRKSQPRQPTTRAQRTQASPQPTQATPTQPATTPQPTTRAARAEAARAVEERPVVREDVVDAEGVPQGEQVVEPAVPVTSEERRRVEQMFKDEPTSLEIPARNVQTSNQVSEGVAFDMRPSPRNRRAQEGDASISYNVGQDGVVNLNLIRTKPEARGTGQARQLMDKFVRDADRQGAPIKLVVAEQDAGTSAAQLESFYEGYGFQRTGEMVDGSPVMVRSPRVADPSTSAMTADVEPATTRVADQDTAVSKGPELSEAVNKGWAETLRALVSQAPDAGQKAIAARTVARIMQLQDAGFEFSIGVTDEGFTLTGGAIGRSTITMAGLGSPSSVKVVLNHPSNGDRSGTKYETVLHEVAHAATQAQIYLKPEGTAAEKLTSLFNDVVRHFNTRVKAGNLTEFEKRVFNRANNALLDPHELLAWGLTNKEMQTWLNSFSVPKRSNGFARIVEIVMDALGFKKDQETALTELLALSDSLLTESLSPYIEAANRLGQSFGLQQNTTGTPTWLLQAAGGRDIAWSADDAGLVRAKSLRGDDLLLLAVPGGVSRVDIDTFNGETGLPPARLAEIKEIAKGIRGQTSQQVQQRTPTQRNLRQEAGIAQTKQTKRETWGTAGVTSLEGLKNLAGVSKNALSDAYYKMLTSTEGVDARVKLAEELATGTKQEYDLVVDGFMNQVKSLVNYRQLNDKDAKSVRDRMMNYLRGNTDALNEVAGQESRAVRRVLGNPKLRQALDKVRGEIDGLTKRIGQEIVRAYEGKEMPESQLEKLKTLKNGLGIYMSRVYEAYIDKNYAPDLLNRYEKGDATAKAVLDPLVDRLTDQVSQLGDLLETARGIAAAENAALAEGGRKETKKPWTRENWEKVSDIPLERMYRDLIGNPNIAREQMFRELEGWFANNVGDTSDAKAQKEKSRKAALQVAKDILLATQQTNQLSTYWRNLRSDDRALRDLKDVPSDVRQALGEIVDPVMRAAFTISRQSAALASLRENNLLFDDMPQLFRTQDQRESGIHDYQVPNNPQAYGKLAGRYTDKLTHDMIVAKNEMFGPTGSFIEFQQTLSDTKGIPAKGGVVAKGALTGATKLSGIQKTAAIIMNTGNFLMDAMGNVSFVLMNGNFDPKTWKEGMAIGAELVGTTFRKQYSTEARRMMRLGVIDPTLTQVDEQVRQAMRETEITTKLRQTSAPVDFARQAKKSVGTGIDLIRDSRALLENVPKIANFLNTEKQLAKAFPNLSKAEIERMTAEKIKNTNINYSRVPKAAKLLETSLISYVASFMSESLRVGVTNVREGIREVRSPNPTIREMGAKRLAGSVMSGAVMTMAINALMDSFGAEELDDDWKLLMNKLGFHEQGQNRKIMDVADDLTVISVDAGRVEGMDVFNMQLRTAAQILQFAAEGETESAIETAKEGFGTLVGLFSGGAPLGKAIVNTATGRQSSNFIQREFPEWYGDTVAGLGEVVGDAAAVRAMESLGSVFDLAAPGAAKQYLRGLASSDIERNPALARAQMLGMPIAFDNPIRTLKGGPVRTYITARNDASDALEPVVALFTEKDTPKLIESAVSNYINTQRDAYTELAKYVDVAKAAGRLAGKSDGEIRDMILEALRSNNGLNREDAVRLADQEPFRPRAPGNEKQFLQGAIDRAVLRVPTDTEAGRLRQERMRELMDERRRQIIEQIRQRVAEYD